MTELRTVTLDATAHRRAMRVTYDLEAAMGAKTLAQGLELDGLPAREKLAGLFDWLDAMAVELSDPETGIPMDLGTSTLIVLRDLSKALILDLRAAFNEAGITAATESPRESPRWVRRGQKKRDKKRRR